MAIYTPEYVCTGDEVAVITTAKGVIKFTFFCEDAPKHAAAFIELAEKGFYDGTKFHRVEPNFVIQGGDPLSRDGGGPAGTGGPGYNLAAEFNSRPHLDGTVAMARAGHPDSAGSQFYICLGTQSFLNNNYTVFGQVTEGLDVVHSITRDDVMESVRIERP
jgi:peptidyl-prolyl cis-trans isomerase B (cyclophilin B)